MGAFRWSLDEIIEMLEFWENNKGPDIEKKGAVAYLKNYNEWTEELYSKYEKQHKPI